MIDRTVIEYEDIGHEVDFPVLQHHRLKDFDWFNDYKDTLTWVRSVHFPLAEEFEKAYDDWYHSTHARPCPFCGSINLGIRYHGQPATEYAILCGNCGARGPMVRVMTVTASGVGITFDNPEALRGWNRRRK